MVLVDANDRPIGKMAKVEAHLRGLLHRAVSVFVRDSNGRLLLQQRAPGKYHSGTLWSNTCCSHPRPGETVAHAAARRLGEEMGISCSLNFLFLTQYCAPVSHGLVENELVHVFGGTFDGVPDPDADEVMNWRWLASGRESPRTWRVAAGGVYGLVSEYCRDHWDKVSNQ